MYKLFAINLALNKKSCKNIMYAIKEYLNVCETFEKNYFCF